MAWKNLKFFVWFPNRDLWLYIKNVTFSFVIFVLFRTESWRKTRRGKSKKKFRHFYLDFYLHYGNLIIYCTRWQLPSPLTTFSGVLLIFKLPWGNFIKLYVFFNNCILHISILILYSYYSIWIFFHFLFSVSHSMCAWVSVCTQ